MHPRYGTEHGQVSEPIEDFTMFKLAAAAALVSVAFYTSAFAGSLEDCIAAETNVKVAVCTQAIAENPTAAKAYYNRGFAHGLLRNSKLAIDDYTSAITLDPKNSDAAIGYRALEYKFLGLYDLSLADYNTLIAQKPNTVHLHWRRSQVHLLLGRAAEGLVDVEKALAAEPDAAKFRETRGLIFEALNRREEAIADLSLAFSRDPKLRQSRDALKRLGVKP
jgi:tetratricopeptide (TPR) repeat protein